MSSQENLELLKTQTPRIFQHRSWRLKIQEKDGGSMLGTFTLPKMGNYRGSYPHMVSYQGWFHSPCWSIKTTTWFSSQKFKKNMTPRSPQKVQIYGSKYPYGSTLGSPSVDCMTIICIIHIYIYIYTSQSDLMKSQYFRCAFFLQTLPKSLRFTCSPQVCLGLVEMTMHTATGQVNSWSSYLVAPGWNLFHRYHPLPGRPGWVVSGHPRQPR